MTSTPWTCTPAGVSGPGALVARAPQVGAVGGLTPAARPRHAAVRSMTPFDLTGTASAPVAVAFRGTGLPTGVRVVEQVGTGVFGTGVPVIGRYVTTTDPKTDLSTTLGNPSSRRPQS